MKQQITKNIRRWLALLLCICMVSPAMTTVVSAAEPQVLEGGKAAPDENPVTVTGTLTGEKLPGAEPVPQIKQGEIGDVLDGDYAYISDAAISPDQSTESKLAIRTGTAPWDDTTGNGNDENDLNNTVRSFDEVTYTVEFQTKVRDGAPYKAYRSGTLHFEFILPATAAEAQFDTGSMGWLESKQGKYEITESIYNGETSQILKGTCVLEPGDDNPSAIGESWQTLNLAIRTLAVKQGDVVQPEFTFWLEYNDVPQTGLVTGSGHNCGVHSEQEFKTVSSPETTVTSAPRFNVQINPGFTSTQYLGN